MYWRRESGQGRFLVTAKPGLLRRGGLHRLAEVAGVLLLLGLVSVLRGGGDVKTATAYFPRAVHVYADSEVSVLGVAVGKVTRVVPEGTQVRVDFEYDAKRKIPADAFA